MNRLKDGDCVRKADFPDEILIMMIKACVTPWTLETGTQTTKLPDGTSTLTKRFLGYDPLMNLKLVNKMFNHEISKAEANNYDGRLEVHGSTVYDAVLYLQRASVIASLVHDIRVAGIDTWRYHRHKVCELARLSPKLQQLVILVHIHESYGIFDGWDLDLDLDVTGLRNTVTCRRARIWAMSNLAFVKEMRARDVTLIPQTIMTSSYLGTQLVCDAGIRVMRAQNMPDEDGDYVEPFVRSRTLVSCQ